MSQEEIDAIASWWCCTPEDFSERRPWPLRNAREDIRRLLDEIVRLQEHEADLLAGLARMTTLYANERDSHNLTMEYVESDGESGLRAW